MVSNSKSGRKMFWAEALCDVAFVIPTSEFWQKLLASEESGKHVQAPPLDTTNQLLSLIREVEFSGNPAAQSVPLQTSDGDVFIVKFEVYLVLEGKVKGCVSILSKTIDYISVLTLIDQLLDERMGGVMITNHNHDVIFVNEALCHQHSVSALTMLGHNISDISLFHQNRAHLHAFKRAIACTPKWQGAMATRSNESKTMLEMVSVRKVQLANRQSLYIYTFRSDFDLRFQSALSTGAADLAARVLDEASFRKKAQELSRQTEKFIVLAFQPNFYPGLEEESRDKVLLALSDFHNRESFGYLGNNTFIVLIRIRHTDSQNLQTINASVGQFLEGLRTYLDDHLINDISEGKVGVALHGVNEYAVDEVISQSLQAMSVHEVASSNINFYDESLVKANLRRRHLERLLINAIEKKEIDVNFQPIVDAVTGQIVKLEALCRFRFEGIKYSVQEVIYLAEELKLISVLDLIVAERAITEIMEIQASTSVPLSISLNCSLAESGEYSDHLHDLFELIRSSSINDDRVTIEITETSYFNNNAKNATLIETIRAAGVKVAVDDFGTGNASFSYFSDFDFDELKIDKKFISNIQESKQKYFAVKMLGRLSHDLDIKVVAEGVETEAEVEVLRHIGIDYIQGYLFYRPMTPSQVEQLLTRPIEGVVC
ncbi:EAL domain-containing protein [Vibrio methylphosphonaticus]|uniref:EAL domain-containing protein n=1 Tax=Vibrio methylphosphonaticus TaxID=2946866 RepID=UPI002029EC24|nr:EAL domain-containing protein [Vibrio methylphosphonaticus]MCL9775822.1 EAL domain-containing protein [Vibrio methylphosphonaticus]